MGDKTFTGKLESLARDQKLTRTFGSSAVVLNVDGPYGLPTEVRHPESS